MDKKLKDKWVKALMSGKYEQGRDCLVSGDRYCCLGVLGDVYGYPRLEFDAYLHDTHLERELPNEIQCELAGLNDEGIPFPVIAGFIQENL